MKFSKKINLDNLVTGFERRFQRTPLGNFKTSKKGVWTTWWSIMNHITPLFCTGFHWFG